MKLTFKQNSIYDTIDNMENRKTHDELIRENASSILNVFCNMLGINQFMIVFEMRSTDDSICASVCGRKDGNPAQPLIIIRDGMLHMAKFSKFMSTKMMTEMMRKPYDLQMVGRAYTVSLRDAAEFYGCSEADIGYELASLLVDYASSCDEMYCDVWSCGVQCPISLEEIMIKVDLEGDV